MDEWDWTPAPQAVESDSPINEEFDPSWPCNFKWAYNVDTGESRVWRVRGGIDGRPSHRAEFRNIWGREPQTRKGDVMGLATYIPAEMKLDGTVVAPPTLLVQAYYKQDIPQGVFDYFEETFPGVIPRRAKIAASGDIWDDWSGPGEDAPQVIKWVWNRDNGALIWQVDAEGLPSHPQKIEQAWGRPEKADDYYGFAVPVGAKLEMETYGSPPPPIAVQTVKQKLAELYPDKDVFLPSDFDTDHGVTFTTDPGTLARRTAAAKWAETTLGAPAEVPLEGSGIDAEATQRETGTPQSPVLVRGLRKLMGLPAVSAGKEADKEGAMVAIFIPEQAGKKIRQKGGEPLKDLHITLAYFAEKAAEREDWDEAMRIVEQIANQHPPMDGKIGGLGVFQNDVDVLWASPSIPGLAELRDDIAEALEDAGFPLNKEHGWVPHITLKYDHKGKLPKLPENITFRVNEISFARGDDHEHFKLKGAFTKNAVEDYLNWSGWSGPYKFATDGKEIITAPTEDHTDAYGLGEELRRRYPDVKQVTEGVAVPTQDDMGYGIYAPTLGWGAPGEPEIHTVISLLDRELGKPTHLIDHNQPFDAKTYRPSQEAA